jgi:hypothetical protein
MNNPKCPSWCGLPILWPHRGPAGQHPLVSDTSWGTILLHVSFKLWYITWSASNIRQKPMFFYAISSFLICNLRISAWGVGTEKSSEFQSIWRGNVQYVTVNIHRFRTAYWLPWSHDKCLIYAEIVSYLYHHISSGWLSLMREINIGTISDDILVKSLLESGRPGVVANIFCLCMT